MNISSIPENYAGAFSDLIYRITDAAPQQIVEVTVFGELSTDVLGMKRFRGQREYDVNVSNYIRRAFGEPQPYFSHLCTSYSGGRAIRAKIGVDGVMSPARTFLAGTKGAVRNQLLSDAPFDLAIAPGQTDDLSFVGSAADPFFIYGFLTRGSDVKEMVFSLGALGEVVSFQINAAHIEDEARHLTLGSMEAYTHLEIDAEIGSVLRPVRRYEIGPRVNDVVRLCWVNAYGALDYYTFARTGAESLSFERQKIYAAAGYKSFDVHADRIMVVESGYESAETVMWLAGIVGSPRVWVCGEAGEFTEVDVMTDGVAAAVSQPSSVRLVLRDRERVGYQSF